MIEQYLSAKWALNADFHNQMAALALRRMANGKTPFATGGEIAGPYLAFDDDDDEMEIETGTGYDFLAKASTDQGQVVIIPVVGTMTRYGGLCSYGSESYASWIMEANADPAIAGIVLELNTPGGQVDGTEMLGEVIRQSEKPVVAYVTGMAASAGYWIASQADYIMLESETTSEVGSIGVLATHYDYTGFLEKEGYKITIVRADGSEDKALFNSVEKLSEAVLAETKEILNTIRGTFIEIVKAGRPGIGEVFSGKMYVGRDAIKLGMADGFGYLGDAVNKVLELAQAAA
ncbi:S49 family peptidase [Siphonobacter sp. SORGH_AS_1065]|uniref:S49 family peptidase n=1 Tax=Siphonobacter sp. SORGH_AS_1065 TaxID=3041795 RepID=UPI0027850464|nr:S49 family peptidase [Siphonobacter sp. SORGH_AS_1065]MDQ1089005.1 protease-4 [Siphonobacter sp. SORGH_AS_1065]